LKNFIPVQRGTKSAQFSIGTINLDATGAAAPYSLKLPVNAGTAGYSLITDGSGNLSWAAPGSVGAAAPDKAVQFNNGGVLAGDAGFTWDVSAQKLQVLGAITSLGGPNSWELSGYGGTGDSTTPSNGQDLTIKGGGTTNTSTGHVAQGAYFQVGSANDDGTTATGGSFNASTGGGDISGSMVFSVPSGTTTGNIFFDVAGASAGGITGSIAFITGPSVLTGDATIVFAPGGSAQLQLNPNGSFGVGPAVDTGTAGQVLTSQGPSASPIWSSAGGGLTPRQVSKYSALRAF
jgi:hypothetical protein